MVSLQRDLDKRLGLSISWAQTCCDSGQLSCVQLLWDYLVKRATRLAVWRACSHNDGSASKWCWKMRRAVIIFTIDTRGKAGWQTSRALMHLIMAGSSASAAQEHTIYIWLYCFLKIIEYVVDFGHREHVGWMWVGRVSRVGYQFWVPSAALILIWKGRWKSPRMREPTSQADLSHWSESDVCVWPSLPVADSRINKNKICLLSRQRLSRVAD